MQKAQIMADIPTQQVLPTQDRSLLHKLTLLVGTTLKTVNETNYAEWNSELMEAVTIADTAWKMQEKVNNPTVIVEIDKAKVT